jgi:hypothetical protein
MVTKVGRASFSYVPEDNHDQDGDSDGTSITIVKPSSYGSEAARIHAGSIANASTGLTARGLWVPSGTVTTGAPWLALLGVGQSRQNALRRPTVAVGVTGLRHLSIGVLIYHKPPRFCDNPVL